MRMSFQVARWRPLQAAACHGCRRCVLRWLPPQPPPLLLCVGTVVVYNELLGLLINEGLSQNYAMVA